MNIREYFGVKKLGDIKWSHAVNSKDKLAWALVDHQVMIVESDVRVSKTGTIVTAHPPETESDLTVDELISEVVRSGKGLKLDFKDEGAVEYTLRQVSNVTGRPIILNADVLPGNGAKMPSINGERFVSTAQNLYSDGMLSLGWTTMGDPKFIYTGTNVEEMKNLTSKLVEVTIPVRACLVRESWGVLRTLLDKPNLSFTIWNNEPVTEEDKKWIQENMDPDRTMFDFIDDNKNSIRLW
jgi:hypothetical protein